jgi:hypothetical protein
MNNPAHEAGVVEEMHTETLTNDISTLEFVAAYTTLSNSHVCFISLLEEALPCEVFNNLDLFELLLISFIHLRHLLCIFLIVYASRNFTELCGVLSAELVKDHTGNTKNNH